MKKLMEEIDTYGFECEAGPLFLCVPWMKLKAKILVMQDEPHGLPWAKRQQEDTTMKVGDIVVVTKGDRHYFSRGDRARLTHISPQCHWWGDFNGMGNSRVEDDGIWCITQSGECVIESSKTETNAISMCWNCDKEYPLFYHKCPECGATNANVHFDVAMQEKEDKTLIRKPSNENHI